MAQADDLPRLWDHPDSPPDLKKRIVRAVLKEIAANSHGDSVHLVLHWQGRDLTELHIKKTPIGQHRHVTSADTIELIRSLARLQSDERIAATINRLGHRTAHGQTWNAMRICAIRHGHDIAVYRDGERQARGEMTVDEAATALKVTPTTVLRLIRHIIDVAAKVLADNLASLMCLTAEKIHHMHARNRFCNRRYAARVLTRVLPSVLMMIGDVLLTIADAIAHLARNHCRYRPGRSTPRTPHHAKPHPRYAYKG